MTAPIISLGKAIVKADKFYFAKFHSTSPLAVEWCSYEAWRFIMNFNALISRLLQKSYFVFDKEKPVWENIDFNGCLEPKQEFITLQRAYNYSKDSYVPLFAGEWVLMKDGSIILPSPMTGVLEDVRIFGKGMGAINDYTIFDITTYATFNLSHPIFSNELKDYKKISEL